MSNNPSATQERIDQLVVAQTIGEIEGYLRAETESREMAVFRDATRFIGALYDEFAPQVGADARMVGQLVGAAGLTLTELRYGKDEFSPKLYGGSFEKSVLAVYHHGAHSRRHMRGGFQYAAAVNAIRPGTYEDFALARVPGISAFHDAILGNGRGNDERQSKLLASTFMVRMGLTLTPDEETEAAIDATTWDDKHMAQAMNPHKPYLGFRRLGAVPDLLSVNTRSGGYEAACVLVEDMCKRKKQRVFTKAARAAGFPLVGVGIDDCMEFIDRTPELAVTFGEMWDGQTNFFTNFKPADPELDDMFPGRPANIALAREAGAAYRAPNSIGAAGLLAMTREFMLAA